MNQQEEDALIEEHQLRSGDPVEQLIRLAIREAVAQERERCAKVCEKNSEEAIAQQSGPTDDLTNIMLRHHASQAYSCAAAIRRGE